MAFNFKEKWEFEMNKKRVMSLFTEDRKSGLKFSDIKDRMSLTSPRINRLLKSLIEEGFLDKQKIGKRHLYLNKFSTYRGDFDIWDLMSRIDKISRKNGRIIKEDMGAMSGLCSVLVYGCPQYERLTPLERDMVFQLINKFRTSFIELKELIDALYRRKLIEKKIKLPKNCKNVIFGEDAREIDFSSVDKIYGDALWNYIFNQYIRVFRILLTKGCMDIHGLKDLFHMLDEAKDTIDREVEKKGRFGFHEFPATEMSNKIPHIPYLLLRSNANNIRKNSVGVMITPSPRSLVEYSDQVGWIIKNQVELWKNYEFMGKEKPRQDVNWEDVVQNLPKKMKRREWLKITFTEELLMRRKNLSNVEKKLMIKDNILKDIFTESEIKKIISNFNNLYSRLLYFYKKKNSGEHSKSLKNDPKWFTKDEIDNYRPICDFVFEVEGDQKTNTVDYTFA